LCTYILISYITHKKWSLIMHNAFVLWKSALFSVLFTFAALISRLLGIESSPEHQDYIFWLSTVFTFYKVCVIRNTIFESVYDRLSLILTKSVYMICTFKSVCVTRIAIFNYDLHIRRVPWCANKTPWYIMPLISMETTKELSISVLPSSVMKQQK
jgi:hypothetical protein